MLREDGYPTPNSALREAQSRFERDRNEEQATLHRKPEGGSRFRISYADTNPRSGLWTPAVARIANPLCVPRWTTISGSQIAASRCPVRWHQMAMPRAWPGSVPVEAGSSRSVRNYELRIASRRNPPRTTPTDRAPRNPPIRWHPVRISQPVSQILEFVLA